MLLFCPGIESDTSELPRAVFDSAKAYLINRVGERFYSQLKFYGCEVVDFKKKTGELKKINPLYTKKKVDKRVRYGLKYYFNVEDSMRYYLSLVYDKNLKLISEHFLPDEKTNADFDKTLDACSAIKIIETDTVDSGDVEEIHLEFMSKENSFVWVASKSDKYEGEHTVITPYIAINAVTGEIIDRWKSTGFIVCRLPSF